MRVNYVICASVRQSGLQNALQHNKRQNAEKEDEKHRCRESATLAISLACTTSYLIARHWMYPITFLSAPSGAVAEGSADPYKHSIRLESLEGGIF